MRAATQTLKLYGNSGKLHQVEDMLDEMENARDTTMDLNSAFDSGDFDNQTTAEAELEEMLRMDDSELVDKQAELSTMSADSGTLLPAGGGDGRMSTFAAAPASACSDSNETTRLMAAMDV